MKGLFSAQATRAIDAYSRLKVRISDDTDMNIKLQDATREFMSNAGLISTVKTLFPYGYCEQAGHEG
jgi:hypothetical protein